MSDLTPTRSLVVALQEERRTMREGYAFLDEKCLLLAGEMLAQVRRHRALAAELAPLAARARDSLLAAVARHGLSGLQVYPKLELTGSIELERRSLLGVTMQDARLMRDSATSLAAINPSPEAQVCRAAHQEVVAKLIELAAVSGNLARLYVEYRKTVRRVRALQDVLLPEVESTLYEVQTSLDELEQDESTWLRHALRDRV